MWHIAAHACNANVHIGFAKINRQELRMTEVVSTRLLVSTARLIHAGLGPRLACDVGVIQPLSDDAEVVTALRELAALHF